MRNATTMKTLFIAITALFLANSALAKSLKLEDFFGGDEIHLFDLCELISDMHLTKAVRENDLGLVRQYIIDKNYYATNMYYTLASQNKLDWDELDEQAIYVADAVKGGILEGFFTSEEIMMMKAQCIDQYYLRRFSLDVKIDGLSNVEFQSELNQKFFKFYGLISD